MLLLDDLKIGRDGVVISKYRAERPKRDLAADAHDLREIIRRTEMFNRIDAELRLARERPWFQNAVPGNGYVVNTGSSAIALSAATAKTIMYTNAGATNQPAIGEICVSFDGVTASATPALVELLFGTKASNSTPGTGSTTFTALQVRGWPSSASAAASANNCTSEPTVLTSLRQWLVTPAGGLLLVQFPMGKEPTGVVSGTSQSGNQIALRCNAPAAVNVRGYWEYDE